MTVSPLAGSTTVFCRRSIFSKYFSISPNWSFSFISMRISSSSFCWCLICSMSCDTWDCSPCVCCSRNRCCCSINSCCCCNTFCCIFWISSWLDGTSTSGLLDPGLFDPGKLEPGIFSCVEGCERSNEFKFSNSLSSNDTCGFVVVEWELSKLNTLSCERVSVSPCDSVFATSPAWVKGCGLDDGT